MGCRRGETATRNAVDATDRSADVTGALGESRATRSEAAMAASTGPELDRLVADGDR